MLQLSQKILLAMMISGSTGTSSGADDFDTLFGINPQAAI
jgi:hypothetical protein